MNKSTKLGPNYNQKPQPKGFQNEWYYGGDDYILYNPYLKPIYPARDPKVVPLMNPLQKADSTEAQVYAKSRKPRK